MLTLEHYLKLSTSLRMGLESGREWISVLKWVSEKDPDPSIRR